MHRTRKLKLLSASGAAAILMTGAATLIPAQASEGQAAAKPETAKIQPWPESRSAASFHALLEKVFEGEGGEGGWGIPNIDKTVDFPALNASELSTLFGGNSLVHDGAYALYFRPGGVVEGYINDEKHVTGTWKVEGDKICMDLSTKQVVIGCRSAALIVDRVILFKPTGAAQFTGLIQHGHYKK